MFVNLEIERIRRRLSKPAMASLMSVSVTTWNAWTSGRRPIPARKLRELSRFFGHGLDYLLEGGDVWTT